MTCCRPSICLPARRTPARPLNPSPRFRPSEAAQAPGDGASHVSSAHLEVRDAHPKAVRLCAKFRFLAGDYCCRLPPLWSGQRGRPLMRMLRHLLAGWLPTRGASETCMVQVTCMQAPRCYCSALNGIKSRGPVETGNDGQHASGFTLAEKRQSVIPGPAGWTAVHVQSQVVQTDHAGSGRSSMAVEHGCELVP